MATGKRVVIGCDTSGNVKVLAEGFTDNSCAEATKIFENAFISKKRTDHQEPEYGIPAPVNQGKVNQRF